MSGTAAVGFSPTVVPIFRDNRSANNGAEIGNTDTPMPTVAEIFHSEGTPPIFAFSTPAPDSAAAEPGTPVAEETGNDRPLPTGYVETVIYADELDSNWTLDHSLKMTYNLWDNSHWFQTLSTALNINSGATAIAATPQDDYGILFFSLRPEAITQYTRDRVLGISFWLNSGDDIIATDDLAVAVIGSNEHPYWTETDHSVFPTGEETFSETRLYYLDINRSVPTQTWVNVVVWLDRLIFDPNYTYVTGFYIKNDVGYRNTFYVDQVTLLTKP
ncbi:MAG: hypothetical protein R3C14_41615 [Caldilineaceae bacterium]